MTRRQGGFCAACGKPVDTLQMALKFFINYETKTVHKVFQFHTLDLYSECIIDFWKIQNGEQFKKDIATIPEEHRLELEIHGELRNILYIVTAMCPNWTPEAEQTIADIGKGKVTCRDTLEDFEEATKDDISTSVYFNEGLDSIILNAERDVIELYDYVNHRKQRTLKFNSYISYSAFRLHYTRSQAYLRLVGHLMEGLRKVKLKSIFKTLDETLAGDITESELQMLFDKLKICPISTLRDLKDLIEASNKSTTTVPVRF